MTTFSFMSQQSNAREIFFFVLLFFVSFTNFSTEGGPPADAPAHYIGKPFGFLYTFCSQGTFVRSSGAS